jgi:hypothetical protein
MRRQPLGGGGLAGLGVEFGQLGLGERGPAVTGRGRVGGQLGQLDEGKPVSCNSAKTARCCTALGS